MNNDYNIYAGTSFVEVISLLQQLNLDSQASDLACLRLDSVGAYRYAREMQTVKVDIGRCTGKTSALLKLTNTNDFVFTYGSPQTLAMDVVLCCPVLCGFVGSTHSLRGRDVSHIDTVWIDEASLLSPAAITEIYHTFCGKAQQFVLLG